MGVKRELKGRQNFQIKKAIVLSTPTAKLLTPLPFLSILKLSDKRNLN